MALELGAKVDLTFALKHLSGTSLQIWINHIEECTGQQTPEDFSKVFRQELHQVFRDQLQPVEGVHELLDRLNMPYCVASSGPLEKIKLSLTTTNLIDKFEGKLFSSYEINSWKPDPGIFLHASEQMGFAPCDCAVIEDSLAGVQAALAGGFDVYAYAPNLADNIFADIANNVFHDMVALGDLLLSKSLSKN